MPGTNGKLKSPAALSGSDGVNLATMFRDMRTEYRAANRDSLYRRPRPGIPWGGASADYHTRIDTDYFAIIEQAYDMARNDTIVGAILRRGLQNVLQGGFGYDSQTGDAALDVDLSADVRTWATTPAMCDVSGRFTLHELASQVGFAEQASGDCFVLPIDNSSLQVVEGYRCQTPHRRADTNIVLGVQIDSKRKPVAYHFVPDDLDPRSLGGYGADAVSYPARDADGNALVWHIADMQRYSRTRAVSVLAPVFDEAGLFDEIKFALLTKMQASACIAFVGSTVGGLPSTEPPQYGEREEVTRGDGTTEIQERLKPGSRIQSNPGESLAGFSPTIATEDDLEFLRFILQLIAAACDLPLVSFLMDGKETNFSGWRGAIEQAKIGWRERQERYERQFYRRAYMHRLNYLLATDMAYRRRAQDLGDAFYRVRINRPRWPYIEPLKEIQAAALERRNLLTSPRRSANDRGYDIEEITVETVADNAATIRAAFAEATKLREETGLSVELSRLLYLDGTSELGQLPALAEDGGSAALVLDSQQVTSALEVLHRVRGGALAELPAVELLAGVGIGRTTAVDMVLAMMPAPDADAPVDDATLPLKRKMIGDWAGSASAARSVLFNLADPRQLLVDIGIKPRDGVIAPLLPIVAEAGELVSGDAISNEAGETIGGGVAGRVAGEPDAEGAEPESHDAPPVAINIDQVVLSETPTRPRLEQYAGPWLIRADTGELLERTVAATDYREHLLRVAADAPQETSAGYLTTGSVAVIEITGTLTKYGSSMLGGTSTLRIRHAIRGAIEDSAVKAIVLLIDSPGGTASGTGDFADDVRRAREVKPVVVYVEGDCCSGAYWPAAQATLVVASPHAWIGSIGVGLVVKDISESEGKLGIKTHVVRAGAFKLLTAPGVSIAEDALTELQREVDDLGQTFVEGVATGRRISTSVAQSWADGRVWLAKDALDLGMIDRISDWDTTLETVERGIDKPAEAGEPIGV